MPTLPEKLHAAMMAAAVPVSSSLMAHHLMLSTTLVNKEKSYKNLLFQQPGLLNQLQMLHKKNPTLSCQYTGQTCHTLRERF